MQPSKEERLRAFSLFSQFKKDLLPDQGLNRKLDDKILLVDGLNTFIRCWAANPMMNDDGLLTGGVAGSLKSIGYAIKLVNPTHCIILFDGDGGSARRKRIYPQYKANRTTHIRLNRTYAELSDKDSEEANRIKQLVRLGEYLQLLPVHVIIANEIEADDSIAFCANEYFKDSKIVIMSSDKDFLQLVSDRVQVWSPTKKLTFGPAEVMREYNIHPNNFVLFRAMDGDKSDNIEGIRGVGVKTIPKFFPFLSEETPRDVKYIIDYAIRNKGKYKIYDKVAEGGDILERNYQLMQLKDSVVSTIAQMNIVDCLRKVKIPRLDRFNLVKLINEDKMWNNIPNHQIWIKETFERLDSMARHSYE